MKKISSQISIILWFFGPSQYIINVFKIKKIRRIKKHKKHVFIEKNIKYVLNNYGTDDKDACSNVIAAYQLARAVA